jgi:type III pantothenate kinase
MTLTIDVGNTSIKTALFDGAQMECYWRISTNRSMSSDEYGILMANLMSHNHKNASDITGIIISSVVPSVNFSIEHMCRSYFGKDPMLVAPGIKTGINIKYENPRELGSDRIANAVAAYEIYGGPNVFIDFGTATTFGAMSKKGEFLGGVICPGLKLAAEALVEHASKLPRFELQKPINVLGRNTVANLQSGIVYGCVGQVQYLIAKIKDEMNAPAAKVIATGGLGLLVAGETDAIDVMDGLLTLKGLRLIYEKNTERL